jgi:hypothetical protein
MKEISLLFFSASLATKLFSVVLVPVFVYIYQFKKFFSKKIILNIFLLFSIPFLYYYFAYIKTGNPFYSLAVHAQKIQEIGGQQNFLIFIFYKIISLPQSLVLFIIARDYVAPILIFSIFPIALHIKEILKNKKQKILLVFACAQWIVWWFVPPLSTRYAISGFVVLLILGLTVFVKQKYKYTAIIFSLLTIYILISMIPRILVAKRSFKYILTPQTNKDYFEQFYDGSIDEKINNWYFNKN